MTPNEREGFLWESNYRRWKTRITLGAKAFLEDPSKRDKVIIAFLIYLLICSNKRWIFGIRADNPLEPLILALVNLSLFMCLLFGIVITFIVLAAPKGAFKMENDLRRAGIFNRAGEAPMLVAKFPDDDNPRMTVLEWESWGIPRSEWEDQKLRIEAALNVYISKISDGSDLHRILLYTVPAEGGLPSVAYWEDEYLSSKEFELVLGLGLEGPIKVNLSHIPHILIGGSTGSGKSVLLKHLLMQAYKKGAEIYISDFKGGVDFSKAWHVNCHMCFDEKTLLDTLDALVEELEERKKYLKAVGYANITDHNNNEYMKLIRKIYACDEVAEVLDKTGLNKEQKELVSQIESKMSIIARQGRAFGIHLILATQRPDANILSGQIRNNIDCRVCGRADNVLSQIILDNTDAADMIPKDARGRFLMNDGTVIQGYWFDDSDF